MGEHAPLPPSSAHIWSVCHGWRSLAQHYDDPETPEAREGTAAHEIGEQLVQQAAQGQPFSPAGVFIGKPASNGEIWNEEMYDAALMYANDVKRHMQREGVFGGDGLGIEQTVLAARVHPSDVWGTSDGFIYAAQAGRLIIWDFKFGHSFVEVFENKQLLCYLAGVLDRFGIDGHADQHLRVEFRIVQPRCFHREGPIRSWTFTASDTRGHIGDLRNAAAASTDPNAKCVSGPHCKNCPARFECGAALRGAANLYEAAAEPVVSDMSPAAIGAQLAIVRRALEQLKALDDGLTAQVETQVRNGEIVPGWMAEPTVGRLNWDKPLAEVFALGDLLGHNLRKDAAITPTRAKQLGIDDAVISAYSSKPSTGVKVVQDKSNKAKKVFS